MSAKTTKNLVFMELIWNLVKQFVKERLHTLPGTLVCHCIVLKIVHSKVTGIGIGKSMACTAVSIHFPVLFSGIELVSEIVYHFRRNKAVGLTM